MVIESITVIITRVIGRSTVEPFGMLDLDLSIDYMGVYCCSAAKLCPTLLQPHGL